MVYYVTNSAFFFSLDELLLSFLNHVGEIMAPSRLQERLVHYAV